MPIRKKLSASLLVLSVAAIPVPNVASGQGSGEYLFCQTSAEEHCIEQVVVTKSDGTTVTYTSQTAISTDGVNAKFGCASIDGNCDGMQSSVQIAAAAAKCSPTADGTRIASLYASGGVTGHKDWSVRIDARVGTFEPAFSLGNGIVDTTTSADPDGSWRYSVTFKPVVTTLATLPAELQFTPPLPADYSTRVNAYLATAVATGASATTSASIWPPRYLYWDGSPSTGCGYIPLSGMWATSNGSGLEFGMRKKTKDDGGTAYEFAFKVSAAHFIKRDMLDADYSAFMIPNGSRYTGELIVNPADIRMMLPKSYIQSLGYGAASEIPTSALSITTEDGQTASPSLQPRSDGSAILDFGIAHFSAPNPALSIKPASAATSNSSVVSTTRTLARGKSVSLTSLVANIPQGTRSWIATGACKVSGTRVIAKSSKGTCTVAVTVKNSSKKVVFRKSVKIRVA